MSSIVSIDTRGYDISMGPGFLRVGGGGGIAGNVYINGNVGIGTSNPTARLSVAGAITVTPTGANSSGQFLRNTTGEGLGWNSRLTVVPYLGLGGYNVLSSLGDVGIIWGVAGSGTNGNLVIAPHSSAGGGLKIMSDGKVGIGTDAPTYTLDVNGMFRSRGIVEIARSTANPNFYIEMGSNSIFKTAFIDFHTGTTEVDYDARIIVDGGTGTTGGGNINIHASNIFLLNGGLKLKNSNTIKGIACGSVAGGTQTGSVSFGFTFDSIPVVTATINATSTNQVFSVTVNNITTTGFNYVKTFLFSDGFAGGGATSESFLWIAIGK